MSISSSYSSKISSGQQLKLLKFQSVSVRQIIYAIFYVSESMQHVFDVPRFKWTKSQGIWVLSVYPSSYDELFQPRYGWAHTDFEEVKSKRYSIPSLSFHCELETTRLQNSMGLCNKQQVQYVWVLYGAISITVVEIISYYVMVINESVYNELMGKSIILGFRTHYGKKKKGCTLELWNFKFETLRVT